jgi:pre-rRNA-processing protein TSR4
MADEDEYDDLLDDIDGEVETAVQLGFTSDAINELFANPNWRDWDGGKVGGKPVWLDPLHIPPPERLRCQYCDMPMTFLLQLYCPLDEFEGAFHRALYVFICRKKKCVDSGSMKCFRCQLPKANEFYPFNPDAVASEFTSSKIEALKSRHLCELCGCRAPHICSNCKSAHYCSREHQKSHWRLHKLTCGKSDSELPTAQSSASLLKDVPLLFPEYDIEVSEEILRDRKDDALDEAVLKANIWDNATEPDVEGGSDDEDDDAALTQSDYNKALGNEASDPLYTKFCERVRRGGGNQILRYCRWDDEEGPLQMSSTSKPIVISTNSTASASASATAESCLSCPRCGAECKFEFQIMPQLLHYLRVDKKTKLFDAGKLKAAAALSATEGAADGQKPAELPAEIENVIENKAEEDIDWGTIDIYTCTGSCQVDANCPEDVTYVEEIVLVQRPLEFIKAKEATAGGGIATEAS